MSKRVMLTSCVLISTLLIMISGMVVGQDNGSGPIDANAIRHGYRPVLKYTVASPRACLINPTNHTFDRCLRPRGDADNFARGDGSMRVFVGTRVVFCLSRDIEGVWYTGSYGCMGSSLILQRHTPCLCTDPANCECLKPDPNSTDARCVCENCLRLGAVCCPTPDDSAIVPCPWVTIGKDGARDCRRGPSIGRAKIGVPVHFRRPGTYLFRAIVHTYAQPRYPLPLEPWRNCLLGNPNDPNAVLPELPMAEDKDVIYIKVRVVDRIIDVVEPDEIPTDDPDFRHIRPMPKDVDPNEPVVLDIDLNGDEVIDLADFAVMAQQWGKEYEMPFTDDE
jgi:hypothetical protein